MGKERGGLSLRGRRKKGKKSDHQKIGGQKANGLSDQEKGGRTRDILCLPGGKVSLEGRRMNDKTASWRASSAKHGKKRKTVSFLLEK